MRFLTAFLLFTAFGCTTNTGRVNQQRALKQQADAAREAKLNEQIVQQRIEIEVLRRDMLQEYQWYSWTHPRKWWVN